MTGSAALATAAAATAAAGAYLNGRLKIARDIKPLLIWSRVQRDFEKRVATGRLNPFYNLEEHVQNPKIADEIFLIYEGKSWTFKQFYNTVLRYAGWLHKTHQIVAGEVVALDFMNCPAFLFLVVAVWSLGAAPALVNYNLTSKSLIHSVKVSTARVLIIDPEVAAQVLNNETKEAFLASDFRNNAFPLEFTVLEEGLQKSLNYFPPYRAPDSVRVITKPSSPGTLMYTSGTTGLPKAAINSWSRLAIGGSICGDFQGLRPVTHKYPDRFYTCMPLYHTTAFSLCFSSCLHSATTLVVGHKFSASKFWHEVRQSDTTIIEYVGETLRYLLAAPPSPDDRNHKVRFAFGNGLRPDVWKRFKARFGIETIIEIYGATEGIGALWNFNSNDYTDGAIGSVGKIGELIALRSQAIVRVDWETEKPWRDPKTGLCQQVPRGEAGELLFKMDPNTIKEKFPGYLGNENATQSKILRNVLTKGDAYWRSGDTVRFDNEGRYWFSDRIGDTFRWKSENVSTAEVGLVLGHHQSVQEANVYGVTVPGYEGRAGCAAIMLREDALQNKDGSITPKTEVLENLATYAANSLPKYAVPVFIRTVRELALTGNNKHQKTGLRDQGINLEAIKQTGSGDKLYWLKPGSNQYVEFRPQDLQALEGNKVRL